MCARGPSGPIKVKVSVSWGGLRRCWHRNTDGTGGRDRGKPLELSFRGLFAVSSFEIFWRQVLAFLLRIFADFDDCLLGCSATLGVLKNVDLYSSPLAKCFLAGIPAQCPDLLAVYCKQCFGPASGLFFPPLDGLMAAVKQMFAGPTYCGNKLR